MWCCLSVNLLNMWRHLLAIDCIACKRKFQESDHHHSYHLRWDFRYLTLTRLSLRLEGCQQCTTNNRNEDKLNLSWDKIVYQIRSNFMWLVGVNYLKVIIKIHPFFGEETLRQRMSLSKYQRIWRKFMSNEE